MKKKRIKLWFNLSNRHVKKL